MKLNRFYSLFACFALVGFGQINAIAKYKALQLKELKDTAVSNSHSYISFAFKKFTKVDCHKYLGRKNIISKGIQPVQIQFTNKSSNSFILAADNFSFSSIAYQEVAEYVYFNTARRLTLWGLGSLLLWPLVIPFVIEAIESPKANEKLDADFQNKSLDFVVVGPHQTVNKIIFTQASEYSDHFSFSVINIDTNEQLNLSTISTLAPLN